MRVAPLLLLLAALASPAHAQTRTDTTVAVGASGTVRIETFHGRARVTGWNRREVRVQASHPSRTEVQVRSREGGVRVEAEGWRGPARDVEFDVQVPTGWAVQIEGHELPVVVTDTRGDVRASNVQGDLIVSGIAGARLETVQGEVMLRDATGDVRIETVNKGVQVAVVTGNVVVEGVNGSISLDDVDGSSVSATTVNGRVQFSGPIRRGGTYLFSTHNGDVTLTLPSATAAEVSVATHGGSIEADFPVQVRGNVMRRGELNFELGAGGASLRIESFNGAIRIRRGR